MLFQFVSVLLLVGSDAAAKEVVHRKRSNLLQHKSTNSKQYQLQQHDERYAAYIGLAEEDNVTNNRQLQNSMSMSMSIPAEVTSWTEEEADGPQHSDVMWTDPNEVAWKEDEDSGSADVIDDTSSGYIRLSYVSLCVVGLAALLI